MSIPNVRKWILKAYDVSKHVSVAVVCVQLILAVIPGLWTWHISMQPLRKQTIVKIEITIAVCYDKYAIIKIYYYKGKLTCVYLW